MDSTDNIIREILRRSNEQKLRYIETHFFMPVNPSLDSEGNLEVTLDEMQDKYTDEILRVKGKSEAYIPFRAVVFEGTDYYIAPSFRNEHNFENNILAVTRSRKQNESRAPTKQIPLDQIGYPIDGQQTEVNRNVRVNYDILKAYQAAASAAVAEYDYQALSRLGKIGHNFGRLISKFTG